MSRGELSRTLVDCKCHYDCDQRRINIRTQGKITAFRSRTIGLTQIVSPLALLAGLVWSA